MASVEAVLDFSDVADPGIREEYVRGREAEQQREARNREQRERTEQKARDEREREAAAATAQRREALDALTPEQRAKLKSAQRLIRAGYEVMPLDDELTPLDPRGSADAERILEWWYQWPDANPGMVVPAQKSVLRVAVESLEDFELSWGRLPEGALRWRGDGCVYVLLEGLPHTEESTPELGIYSAREPVPLPPSVGEDGAPFEWEHARSHRRPSAPAGFTQLLNALANERPLSAPEDDNAPRVRIVRLDELANRPRATDLFSGLGLLAPGVSVLYGPSGAGKTFAALDWSLHVAAGLPWLGYEALGGSVVYLAAEGADSLQCRVDAWQERRPGTRASRRFLPILDEMDLTTDEGSNDLERAIMRQLVKPRLLVVDTLSAVMSGHEENASGPMTAVLANLRRLSQTYGMAVLVVHHTTKRGGGPRGHSSLYGGAELVVEATGSGDQTRLVWEKVRDAAAGLTMDLRRVPVADSCVLELVESAGASPAEETSDIIAALEELGEGLHSQTAVVNKMSGKKDQRPKRLKAAAADPGCPVEAATEASQTRYRLSPREDPVPRTP